MINLNFRERQYTRIYPEADPRFPKTGAPTLIGGTCYSAIFSKKCMKMKKIGPKFVYVDPPWLEVYLFNTAVM